MNFPKTYRAMNQPIEPSPALTAKLLSRIRRRPFRLRVVAAIAAVILALCAAMPAAVAASDPFYEALYWISPAAAQFFQPVRVSCASGGAAMEVISVHVEDDQAQAYIALTGDAVDETCDLFDSCRFHLPYDMSGHCQQVDYDETTRTAVFLCTVRTMDGTPIPAGGKMTFSVGCFLSGREEKENLAVELSLADFALPAETVPAGKPGDRYAITGGGGWHDEDVHAKLSQAPMLLPQSPLAEPAEGGAVTAAGYADGLFHIQICRGNATLRDPHCILWLLDGQGNRIEPLYSAAFAGDTDSPNRQDYTQFAFDVSPEELPDHTLWGNFYTSGLRVDGNWRVTFRLENS